MRPEGNANEAMKSMYKSGIRASYFAGFQDKKFVEKSRLQVSRMEAI